MLGERDTMDGFLLWEPAERPSIADPWDPPNAWTHAEMCNGWTAEKGNEPRVRMNKDGSVEFKGNACAPEKHQGMAAFRLPRQYRPDLDFHSHDGIIVRPSGFVTMPVMPPEVQKVQEMTDWEKADWAQEIIKMVKP